ncbi:penicillin-binding protein 2, partial [bacterium]|nr:penicillin-binding protein 2 [bacterium]
PLQAMAESLLEGWRGAIVFLDTETGGVRVLASSPTFDPNLFATGIGAKDWQVLNTDPNRPLLNRTVQAQYAPGSTFKMISAALALENGLVGFHQELEASCVGGYQFGNRWFRCWEDLGHGKLTMEGALVQSCDVYFYQIAERTSVDDLAAMARAAGLGAPTGIDLPQEVSGNVPTAAWLDQRYGVRQWTRGTMLNLIIGQGEYLVTPLQMAAYAATLANSGRRMVPQLVSDVEDKNGDLRPVSPVEAGRWELSRRTMSRMRESMRLVVEDEDGTGRVCRVKGYMPAGKTGTAENPHGAPHSWFVGYAPYDAPEVAFAVVVEAGGHGSDLAAPIVKKLLSEIRGPLPGKDAS